MRYALTTRATFMAFRLLLPTGTFELTKGIEG